MQFEIHRADGVTQPVGNCRLPKDRKKTYSDRQSQAARDKKRQHKKKTHHEDFSQAAARIVRMWSIKSALHFLINTLMAGLNIDRRSASGHALC